MDEQMILISLIRISCSIEMPYTWYSKKYLHILCMTRNIKP